MLPLSACTRICAQVTAIVVLKQSTDSVVEIWIVKSPDAKRVNSLVDGAFDNSLDVGDFQIFSPLSFFQGA